MNSGNFRAVMIDFARDEEGAVMAEYVILITAMMVAFIWVNKTADAVLFGADPYRRFGDPTQREPLDPAFAGTALEAEIIYIGDGEGEPSDRAYLSQLYIHLSRP